MVRTNGNLSATKTVVVPYAAANSGLNWYFNGGGTTKTWAGADCCQFYRWYLQLVDGVGRGTYGYNTTVVR